MCIPFVVSWHALSGDPHSPARCVVYALGYGGGMSSAKAALESDTRTLAFEAGRKFGIRINAISAGPLKSRAASVRFFFIPFVDLPPIVFAPHFEACLDSKGFHFQLQFRFRFTLSACVPIICCIVRCIVCRALNCLYCGVLSISKGNQPSCWRRQTVHWYGNRLQWSQFSTR